MDAAVAPGTAARSTGPPQDPRPLSPAPGWPRGPAALLGFPLLHPLVGIGARCRLQLSGCQLKPSSAQRPPTGPQLGFTLLLRQKPIIKPLARGQSDNTPQRLRGPPPLLSRQSLATPITHHGCMPDQLSITPGIAPGAVPGAAGDAKGTPWAAGAAHPPLPSPGTGRAASSRPDKAHFAFPNRAGENCNKDKVRKRKVLAATASPYRSPAPCPPLPAHGYLRCSRPSTARKASSPGTELPITSRASKTPGNSPKT